MLKIPRTPLSDPAIAQTTDADIPGIVELQARHLDPASLSWQTSADDLHLRDEATMVAKMDDQVVGYLLTFDLEHNTRFSQAKALFRYLDRLAYAGKAIQQYRACLGQVLVDRRFQGQGIGQKLYAGFLQAHQERFALRLASIHEQNQPAIKLHTHALGMEEIGRFTSEAGTLVVLAWSLQTHAQTWAQHFARRIRSAE